MINVGVMRIVIICIVVLYGNLCFSQDTSFKAYSQVINNTDLKIGMVPVPGGTFIMGSAAREKNRNEDEGPAHKVNVSAFWIGTHEIPWNIYELFVYGKDADSGKTVDAVTRPTKPYVDMTFGMGKDNHPAVAMTQYNAIQFCKWLYKQSGIFYRLPTEAEWEYACRAGSTSAYHFGDDPKQLAEYACFAENSNGKTMPVGSKKPNKWGLYDMHGNVSEWTIDQYIPDYYEQFKNETATDPVAIPQKLYPHTLRGGSFADDAAACRSAARKPSDPSWKQMDPQIPKSNWWFPEAPFVGLRVVRPLRQPSQEEIEAYYNKAPIKDF